MSHAEICPICKGKGTIEDKESTCGGKSCHGCSGSGWVTVQDQYPISNLPSHKWSDSTTYTWSPSSII